MSPGVLANDTDPTGKPLTAGLISGPEHGTLTLNPNGSFIYTNDGSAAPSDSFRYKANNGTTDSNPCHVTIAVSNPAQGGTAPQITSGPSATFTVGSGGSFTVVATGSPAPAFSESGPLPPGVTFNTTTHILSGTPAVGSGRTYPISFTVTNVVGTTTQLFTLTVNEAPSFTSTGTVTTTVGGVVSMTVTASGSPAPSIVQGGTLPPGINYNLSTHLLSGIPSTAGIYNFTFTATNALGTATQNFTLTVNQPPAITSANATTFTVGTLGTFTVTATGFPAPTLGQTGALPTGVAFNAGTGVLSGTPAAGTGGLYSITFTAGTTSQPFT